MSRLCYVYVMRHVGGMSYKVGYSFDPERRATNILSSMPSGKLKVVKLYEFPCRDDASRFETLAHSALFDRQRRGEWFKLEKEDLFRLDCLYLAWEAGRDSEQNRRSRTALNGVSPRVRQGIRQAVHVAEYIDS